MAGLDLNQNDQQQLVGAVDPSINPGATSQSAIQSKGSSIQDSSLEQVLNSVLDPEDRLPTAVANDHDHAPQTSKFVTHVDDLSTLNGVRSLDAKKVTRDLSFKDDLGDKGDLLNPRGGNNVVIGSGDSDIIRGTGQGFNTITTGGGKDSIILGKETTNRVFDFDPTSDRFVLAGINPKNIVIAQGKNPGKGALEQPLDSVNNALVIDKQTGHILAALPFVKATDLNESHFVRDTKEAEVSLKELKAQGFFKNQTGDGKLSGTQGHDRLLGREGDDFLYVGDDGFSFNKATGGGGTEFPFATDSPGTSELNLELKNGVLKATGSYTNFDGLPLFSQGETSLDPNAKILSGANPQALMEGFLKVPKDVEGNLISGTHLHFSTAGDNRGNFADATVIRYFENTPTDAKSGTIKGEFELSPEEQAALLAGNLYVNIHTNIDGDGDGEAGFATGENRLNFNKNVVQFS